MARGGGQQYRVSPCHKGEDGDRGSVLPGVEEEIEPPGVLSDVDHVVVEQVVRVVEGTGANSRRHRHRLPRRGPKGPSNPDGHRRMSYRSQIANLMLALAVQPGGRLLYQRTSRRPVE